MTRRSLVVGACAGLVFILTLVIAGATRSGYDAFRHPGSSLELGPFGWVQRANFILVGAMTVALAVGLRAALRPGRGSLWGPRLIGVWGFGLIGAGVFVTDPVSGYPIGTPAVPTQPTWHGQVHDTVSLIGFLALAVACFVFAVAFLGQRRKAIALYSAGTGMVFVVAMGLANAAFAQADELVDYGGLFQRIAIVAAFSFLTVLALRSNVSQRATVRLSRKSRGKRPAAA